MGWNLKFDRGVATYPLPQQTVYLTPKRELRFIYGFGKDYQILNLDQGTQQNHLELYLVACLLSFFQQQRLYHEQGNSFRLFNIENPLWVFVGGRVTATLAKKDATDILEILQFLDRYVADRAGSIRRIERVLNQRPGHRNEQEPVLPGASSTSIFADSRRRRCSMRLLRHSSTPLVAAGSISRT